MDHYDDGTYHSHQADDEVFACACGRPFLEHDELLEHIRQEGAPVESPASA